MGGAIRSRRSGIPVIRRSGGRNAVITAFVGSNSKAIHYDLAGPALPVPYRFHSIVCPL